MEGQNNESKRENQANFSTFASLVSGCLLLATGFFAGWYWQNASVQDVVKVEVMEGGAPTPVPITAVPAVQGASAGEEDTVRAADCKFVGSKNSDQYHSPDSAPAKRIKPENRVCFASPEEALEEGYEEGTVK